MNWQEADQADEGHIDLNGGVLVFTYIAVRPTIASKVTNRLYSPSICYNFV